MIYKIRDFLEKYGIYLLLAFAFLLGVSVLFFQNPTLDDALYLRETMIMSEVFQNFEWIGNYAVGIHGFLFKIPVALAFIFTGPSLAVAAVWTILLGLASLYLFYVILKKLFKSNLWALGGTLLLFTNFQFILNFPTYMREIPAILCLLLVVYCLLFKRNSWLLGLCLLLLLDAKEYVMLIVSVGILIYIFFAQWVGWNFESLKKIITEGFKTFFPSFVLVILMSFTTLVPVNMFLFSVLPVTESGIEYNIRHFETDMATQDLHVREDDSNNSDNNDTVVEQEEPSVFENVWGVLSGYVNKLFYPYSFSFLSVPEIIFFPALLTSIFIISDFKKNRRFDLMALAFMFFAYSLVFLFRASFTRYLFPILPVILIFFLYFLRDFLEYKKRFLIIFLITLGMIIGGLFFETEYVLIKAVLNLVLVVLLLSCFLTRGKNIFYYLRYIFVLTLCFFSFGVISFFFYSRDQIHTYMLWGREYEVHEVVEHFDKEEKIMLNDPGWCWLPKVYRGDTDSHPEVRWELKEWVPRKDHFRNLGRSNTYELVFRNVDRLKSQVDRYDIDRIGLLVSEIEEKEFPMQEHLEDLKEADSFYLEKEVDLKNKTLFIFNVIE